jgi:hypothetical protein
MKSIPAAPATTPRLRHWNSARWTAYFRVNARDRLTVPWEAGAGATPEELAAIAGSLRAWQLGESSDGAHLLAAAQSYAGRVNDPEFLEAIRLFIAEEQRHGADLGRFLDLAGIPRKSRDWGDTFFRAIRYLVPRMEIWATPVVMVETHAMLYYRAIHDATGSPVLKQICTQILRDEMPHIRFQCERLSILHRRRPRPLYAVTMACHRVFFAATTLAVWLGHRRALRAGGYGFRRFWREAWSRMRQAWRMMDPRNYVWEKADAVGAAA